MAIGLVHYGDAYIVPEQNSRGSANRLHVLDPTKMELIPNKKVPGGVQYIYGGIDLTGVLVHQRYITQPGKVVGLGALEAAKQSIRISAYSQNYMEQHFKHGANIKYLLMSKDAVSSTVKQDFKDHMEQYWQGTENAFQVGIMEGDAKLLPMSATAQESQLQELSRWIDTKIVGQIYQLPLSVMGVNPVGKPLTYSNEESRENKIWRDALKPVALCISSALSLFLTPGYKFILDGKGMLLGSAKNRADIANVYSNINKTLGIWAYTLDENREVTGHMSLDGEPEPLNKQTANGPSNFMENEEDVEDVRENTDDIQD